MAEQTRLDTDTTKPSKTAPGDGPADTTDPTERASTVTPQPGPEALKAGTVNAAVPIPSDDESQGRRRSRVEETTTTRPDGTVVTVQNYLDVPYGTPGKSRVKPESTDTGSTRTQHSS